MAGPTLLVVAALAVASTRGCVSPPPPRQPDEPALPQPSESARPAATSPLAFPGRFRVTLHLDEGGRPTFGPIEPAVPGDVRLLPPPEGIDPASPALEPSGAEVTFLLTVAPDGTVHEIVNVGAPTVPPPVLASLRSLLSRSRFEPYRAEESATVAFVVRLAAP